MFSKTTKAAVVAVALAFTLMGTACTPSPADTYTGEATVESTDVRKKNCYAKVVLSDGQKDTIKIGRRVNCNIPAKTVINIVDGEYKK